MSDNLNGFVKCHRCGEFPIILPNFDNYMSIKYFYTICDCEPFGSCHGDKIKELRKVWNDYHVEVL